MAQATQQTKIPISGSGDIVDAFSLQQRLARAPGVKRVLIGRGAIRNPWLFLALQQKRDVALPYDSLVHALACYGLLQQLMHEKPEALWQLVRTGLFTVPCGTDQTLWRDACDNLSAALYGEVRAIEEIEFIPVQMGRIKMLWSYLRSSLPEEFFEPLLLRSRTWPEFLAGVSAVRGTWTSHSGDAYLPLLHKAQYGWLYSGERRTTELLRPGGPAAMSTSSSGNVGKSCQDAQVHHYV